MTGLVLDIWQDLREKRLVPVAAALALALVAVPALLLGRGSEETGAPPVEGAAAKAERPVVQAADERAAGASSLEAFDPKDPFRAAAPAGSAGNDGDGAAVVRSPASGGAQSSGATPPSGGGGTAGGGGAAPATSPAPAPTPKPKTGTYIWVADLEFGRRGRERRRRGVKRLTILPRAEDPLLVFLGITADRRRAVFLVDSTLATSGEGRCKPTARTCTFLYLATDREKNGHVLRREDGRRYVLRLLEIRRQLFRPRDEVRRERKRRRRAPDQPNLFDFPLFAEDESGR